MNPRGRMTLEYLRGEREIEVVRNRRTGNKIKELEGDYDDGKKRC